MSGLDDWQNDFLRRKERYSNRKESRRQYYKAHKAERNAYDRAYYASHREELNAKARAKTRAKRQEQKKGLLPHSHFKSHDLLTISQIKSHKYYLQNRERILAYSKARYKRLRDERNDNQR